ncbi:carbohydrate kinase family protein [Maribellus mangrovi]|uniref:carbohydrate kinase family protein n=1 Tax=Maribellus mangrovi TaxID=3133146 RepID=UPI0030EE511B
MNSKNDYILCFGEVLWDRLPTGAKPGGAPMNVALHLRAAGLNVSFASCVGQDEPGDRLRDFLQNSGLKTNLIQVDKTLPTSEVLVKLDENRNASYEICEPVAWDNISLDNSLLQEAQNSGLLVYGSLASRNKTTRETLLQLLETDATKLIDVNLRAPFDKQEVVELLLSKSDIVKLNDDELDIIARWYNLSTKDEEQKVKWMVKQYGIKMLCVTKGANGALLCSDNEFFHHPGYKVHTIDTVGAGDAFLSGLITALLKKQSPGSALNLACATGAFVASKAGATPKYNWQEIQEIINQK